MSLAHSRIKDLQLDKDEHDPEIIDILRGVEQHVVVRRMHALARLAPASVDTLVTSAVINGFLLGQAWEQANSLKDYWGTKRDL